MLSVALLRSRLAVAGPNGQRLTVEDAGALGGDQRPASPLPPLTPRGLAAIGRPCPGLVVVPNRPDAA